MDNDRKFDNKKFKDFCVELYIEHRFTSMAHLQSNGEVEVKNRTILQGLKTRLTHAKASWADDLYNIPWAYRTTLRTLTKKSPFKLTFDTEAIIPLDIELPILRAEYYDHLKNEV